MDRRKVYVFSFPAAKHPTGLALNCHIHGGGLRFFDTNRGHDIEGVIIHDEDEYFLFDSKRCHKGLWFFKLLTIDDFQKEIYKIVENGPTLAKTIRTTDDLHEWYRHEYGEDAGLLYPDVLEE